MICRAVVGWGGKGVRGDTDRIGAKLLGGILSNILASQYALGLTASNGRCRPPAAAGWSARTAGSHRLTRGRSTARSAACACSAADRRPEMPTYDYECAACGRRFEVVHGVHAESPTTCPLCGKGPSGR